MLRRETIFMANFQKHKFTYTCCLKLAGIKVIQYQYNHSQGIVADITSMKQRQRCKNYDGSS